MGEEEAEAEAGMGRGRGGATDVRRLDESPLLAFFIFLRACCGFCRCVRAPAVFPPPTPPRVCRPHPQRVRREDLPTLLLCFLLLV